MINLIDIVEVVRKIKGLQCVNTRSIVDGYQITLSAGNRKYIVQVREVDEPPEPKLCDCGRFTVSDGLDFCDQCIQEAEAAHADDRQRDNDLHDLQKGGY